MALDRENTDFELSPTPPTFSAAPQGYEPEEVDRYIDDILHRYTDLLSKYRRQRDALIAIGKEAQTVAEDDVPPDTAPDAETDHTDLTYADLRGLDLFEDDVVDDPITHDTAPKKAKEHKPKKKRSTLSIIGNVIFYIVLALVVAAAVISGSANSGGAPRTVAGYAIFNVLTESMQAEIPKDSLVLTYHCPAEELQIGDDITFLANKTTVVTHRIVDIIDDYEDTGERAFITQGIMNPEPDVFAPIPYVNVLGKVIFHNYVLGVILSFLKQYWLYLLLGAVILFAVAWMLKVLIKVFRTPDDSTPKHHKEPSKSEQQPNEPNIKV